MLKTGLQTMTLHAGFDSQMILVRNTLWSRRFFRQGAELFDKRADLKEVC